MQDSDHFKKEEEELGRVKMLLEFMEPTSKACSTVSNAIEKNEPKVEDKKKVKKSASKHDFTGNILIVYDKNHFKRCDN